MLYTCETIDAQELFALGGGTEIVPADQLEDRAREVASQIAGKSGKALRLGKQALNGIELLEPKTSYRYEQGFTLELYTTPDSQEARDAFVEAEALRTVHSRGGARRVVGGRLRACGIALWLCCTTVGAMRPPAVPGGGAPSEEAYLGTP